MSDLIRLSDAIALADGAGYLSIEALQSIPALIEATAERDALRLERDQLLSVLQTIADQKPHPLGETPNAYHMRELARAALQEDTPND